MAKQINNFEERDVIETNGKNFFQKLNRLESY